MNLYLADIIAHPNYIGVEKNKITLFWAGEHTIKNGGDMCKFMTDEEWSQMFILESYYYARKNVYFPALRSKCKDLLLDSGAFSVMDSGMRVDSWDRYIEEYAAFINRYDIHKFIELDIECVVGMKEVERLRAKLEHLTGRQCIPVWHKWRGLDYFKKMCDEYPYVCFGGLMSDGIKRADLEKVFPWFIAEAHKRGTKIHGLGYTPLDLAKKPFRFDSVDSSSWVSGNRFGHVYQFDPRQGVMKMCCKKAGQRVKHIESAVHNLHEWRKYQQYLSTI